MTELMIEAHEVSKKFGDVTALDGVSVTAKKGSVLGLLGHNGAGKTTLVNLLTTMLPPIQRQREGRRVRRRRSRATRSAAASA